MNIRKTISRAPLRLRLFARYVHLGVVHRNELTGDITIDYIPENSFIEDDENKEFVLFLTTHRLEK